MSAGSFQYEFSNNRKSQKNVTICIYVYMFPNINLDSSCFFLHHPQLLTSLQSRITYMYIDDVYILGCPCSVTVTTRIVIFSVGDPHKLHFPLLLGGMTTQGIYGVVFLMLFFLAAIYGFSCDATCSTLSVLLIFLLK